MSEILKGRLKEFESMAKDAGVEYFPIEFEIVPQEVMLEVTTYALPSRARHWVYGQSYDHQKSSGEMGHSKIYEVIMNNDPSYAFLLDTNDDVTNTMVMAHCVGHSSFFLTNYLFEKTDRKMVYHAAERAQRIEEYIQRYGIDKVEHCMNMAFSMDRHIDWSKGESRKLYPQPKVVTKKLKSGEFDDLLNPNAKKQITYIENEAFPPHSEYDLLWFAIHYGNLEDWQKDVFEIIRQESYYFYPQYNTKIMNEGFACVTGDSLVNTDLGIVTMKDLIENSNASMVFDGSKKERILAKGNKGKKECVKITTSSGLQITGADNHRVLMRDFESWKQLDQLCLGDEISVSIGADMWPTDYQNICWIPRIKKQENAKDFVIPEKITEDLASFVGYLVGGGHISKSGKTSELIAEDLEQLENFAKISKELFGLKAEVEKTQNKQSSLIHSEALSDFLINYIGLAHSTSAKIDKIPDIIMNSPKSVMSAFLRSYFDCNGRANIKDGIILRISDDRLSEMMQIVLMNYGISCKRQKDKNNSWQIRVTGKSAILFNEQVGFGLERKKKNLEAYISNHKQWHREKAYDKIVKIEKTSQVVYDISVSNSHRYVANGMINHNSFIHADFMSNCGCLTAEEHMDFCRVHERVVQPGGNPLNINPYYLGFTILQDIRKRWDNYKQSGESNISGMEKVIQVVKDEDDISFIKNYLTKELVNEMNLFAYKYEKDKSGDSYITIQSREPDDVAEFLTKDMHNYRSPLISIEKATSSSIELKHYHNGKTLDLRNLKKVMGYMHQIYGCQIDIETVDEQEEVVYHTFDEDGFSGD